MGWCFLFLFFWNGAPRDGAERLVCLFGGGLGLLVIRGGMGEGEGRGLGTGLGRVFVGRWGQVSGEGGLGMDNDRGVRGWSASPGNLLEVCVELWCG